MTRTRCAEGDLFTVPLSGGGFAAGLVTRSNNRGVLFGYFFGPARTRPPTLNEVSNPRAEDAVLVGKFGHLGLAEGRWPVLGRMPGWDRTEWPMPALVRYEELTGRTFLVTYDDLNPIKVVREDLAEPGVAEHGPKDGLMGAGFVERILTRILGIETME